MSIDATAQALAGDEVLPGEVEIETPDEDADLGAAFDKAQVVEPQEAETQEAPEPDVSEAPSDIPKSLRDHWAQIPQTARDAITESQRDMARKLGDQGRLISGIEPIRSALSDAVRDMPFLSGMKPGEVASEIMQLAKAGQELNSKPVETMLSLARRYGVEDKLRAAFSGQPPESAVLLKQISELKGEVERLSNPDYLREQVSAVTRETQVHSEVENFAKTAEYWAKVEDSVPLLVPYARTVLGEGASTADVLKFAYERAINELPEVKAKAEAAQQAASQPDPAKAEAALRAKSANITGRETGRARALSEDEQLGAVFDRVRSR